VELRQLEAFVEAARSGSMSRAAETLYLTQPSLTQRVRALEMDLGQQLLVRSGRGMRLTTAGRLFLPRAAAALLALRRGAEEVKTLREVQGGRLAVGASPDVAAFVLPAALGRFAREHPTVELYVHTDRALLLAAMVITEQIDVAIVNRLVRMPELLGRRLFEERLLPVAAPDHPLAAQVALTVDELGSAGLVVREPESHTYQLTMAFFTGRGVTPRVAVRADCTETIKRMIAAGIGVGLAPELSIGDAIAGGRLVVLHLNGAKLPVRELWALQRDGAPPSAALRTFYDCLVAEGFPRQTRPRRAAKPLANHAPLPVAQ
jgi:DNA-binding transcriptional LysR family regulator